MRHWSLSVVAGTCLFAAAAEAGDDSTRRAVREARVADKIAKLESYRERMARSAPALQGAAEKAASSAPPSETVSVDCTRGKSVSEAIAASKARKLRVEVSGTCAETVVVERIGVTISGTAAGGATIDPPDVGGVPSGPAVRALGAHELALEDLVLTGGLNGLSAVASRQMTLTRVSAVGNTGTVAFEEGYGVRLEGSEATISDSDLSSNGTATSGGPLLVISASQAVVADSTMTNNPADGPFSFSNSDLRMLRCTLTGNGFGPQAILNSFTLVNASTLDGAGTNVDFADLNSVLEYRDSTLTNMVDSFAQRDSALTYLRSSVATHFLSAGRSSQLELLGSTFQSLGPPEEDPGLYVEADSYVRTGPARRPDLTVVPANITGNVFLSRFSDGTFVTGSPIQGTVSCSQRSRVTTNLAPTGATTGCE